MVNCLLGKSGDRGFEPHSDSQVSKKQNASSPLTRKDSILQGASMIEWWRVRPQTARAQFESEEITMKHTTTLFSLSATPHTTVTKS